MRRGHDRAGPRTGGLLPRPSFRAAAAAIVPLVALGTFLAGLKAYHFDAAFQFAQRTLHQVWIILIAAAVNVGLNLVAIPAYGINGAAGASVLAYVVSIALTASVGRRHFVLPFPARACGQVTLAAGVMALLLYPLRDYRSPPAFATQVAGGAAVYGAVLFALQLFGARDGAARKWRAARAKSEGAASGPSPLYSGERARVRGGFAKDVGSSEFDVPDFGLTSNENKS